MQLYCGTERKTSMSWFEKAEARLKAEFGEVKEKYAAAMKKEVRDALLEFARQDEEFAQAIAEGGTFKDCMAEVAKGIKSSLSDIEAYRRAVCFYFQGAEVRFEMRIQLTPDDEGTPPKPIEAEKKPEGILIDLTNFF